MSIVRRDTKFEVERDSVDYLADLGSEFVRRFEDGARQWVAIVMREDAGMSWRDLARALDRCNAESTARSIYARARKNLRKMLAETKAAAG